MQTHHQRHVFPTAIVTSANRRFSNGTVRKRLFAALGRYSATISVVLFLSCAGSITLEAQYTGCSAGPYSSCVDQIPATFLSGSWVDTGGQTEWTPTANNASFGVAGNVTSWSTYPPMLAFNPSDPGCPVVTFQIASSSSYTPSSLSSSEGSTPLTWIANNPHPTTECGGWVPVSSLTITATAANKGNDTISGTYRNSAGGSGPWVMETNLPIWPTSETLALTTTYQDNGFGPPNTNTQTMLFVNQTLNDSAWYDPPDPYNNKFTGRQVYELAGSGTTSDGCYIAAQSLGKMYPGGPMVIQGSIWNVGGLFTENPNAY
jgi:hypothetical protein